MSRADPIFSQAHEYESLDIKEGDDISWVHPYFGG